MSKVSNNYPTYGSGTVSIGGSKAQVGVANGTLSSSYKMSDDESAIYNYALNTLTNILPQLNTFSPDTSNLIKSEIGAYKNKGIQAIDGVYNPMINNLTNNVASRFGNLDNSIFKDNLDNIESERAKSISAFAQDVLAKQNGLESNELAKRYSLVELLNGIVNNSYDRALGAISTALNGSSNINNYNGNLYKANSSMSRSNPSSSINTNELVRTLLGLSGNSSISSLLNL